MHTSCFPGEPGIESQSRQGDHGTTEDRDLRRGKGGWGGGRCCSGPSSLPVAAGSPTAAASTLVDSERGSELGRPGAKWPQAGDRGGVGGVVLRTDSEEGAAVRQLILAGGRGAPFNLCEVSRHYGDEYIIGGGRGVGDISSA